MDFGRRCLPPNDVLRRTVRRRLCSWCLNGEIRFSHVRWLGGTGSVGVCTRCMRLCLYRCRNRSGDSSPIMYSTISTNAWILIASVARSFCSRLSTRDARSATSWPTALPTRTAPLGPDVQQASTRMPRLPAHRCMARASCPGNTCCLLRKVSGLGGADIAGRPT